MPPEQKNENKNNCDLQPTKDFTKLDLQQTNFEKCDLEIVAPRHPLQEVLPRKTE